MADPSPLLSDPLIRLGVRVTALGLGGFLLWAILAPLDEGVIASGTLIVEGDRKQIAHFEGGIVREIFVAEGSAVAEGDPLITLEPIEPEAQRDELAQTLVTAQASLARLEALRSSTKLAFHQADGMISDEAARSIIDQQERLYREQKENLEAELALLATQKASADDRAVDLERQLRAVRQSLRVAKDELTRRRDALREQLDIVDNVARAERDMLALQAEEARLVSEQNSARRASEEATNKGVEVKTRFRRTLEEEAAEAGASILALTERLAAYDNRLARTALKAPLGGTVLGLSANTIGGIVGPGELVMEIVPQDGQLVASLKLPPVDREAVRPGQKVKAQLSAYKQYRVPRIEGEVTSISADLKEDLQTGVSFYEARVILDPDTLRGLDQVELVPGLPVEAFVSSGRKRTFLDYVLEPISTTVRRGLSLQ